MFVCVVVEEPEPFPDPADGDLLTEKVGVGLMESSKNAPRTLW
jgi:hypothetical protein